MKENAENIYDTTFGTAFVNNNTTGMQRSLERYVKLSRTGTNTRNLGYLAYILTNPFVQPVYAVGNCDKAPSCTEEQALTPGHLCYCFIKRKPPRIDYFCCLIKY